MDGCISREEHRAGIERLFPVRGDGHWSGVEAEKACLMQAAAPAFIQAGKVVKKAQSILASMISCLTPSQ